MSFYQLAAKAFAIIVLSYYVYIFLHCSEAGCIPSYELLGLTRLGRPIKAIILVGDKHQLPPYDPMQGRRFGRGNSFGANRSRRNDRAEGMQSLLDSSVLTIDSGKVMLTTQYRVPQDIANKRGLRLLNQLSLEYDISSTLVITPVSCN